jgi:hypothetical protein
MEPFVFAFSPGEGGAPRVMYVADVQCACGLCGHPQLQRFYHAVPFHPLTLGGLARLARNVNAKAGYSCPNCGTPVGPGEVERGAIIYGFPDDAGTLMATVDYLAGGQLAWELTPERRLDPQVQPRFVPDPAAEPVAALDEALVHEVFGRAFNLKALWREVALDWARDPDGGALAHASAGCVVALERDPDALAALLEAELGAREDADDLVAVPLTPGAPRVGGFQGWMPADTLAALERGDAYAEVLVSEEDAAGAVRRAFEVGRLRWSERVGDDDLLVFDEIATPRGEPWAGALDLGAVLEQAACTGITPGEAGRLAAEQVVGALLRVW